MRITFNFSVTCKLGIICPHFKILTIFLESISTLNLLENRSTYLISFADIPLHGKVQN